MFTKINNANVVSSEGYTVKYDRSYVSYVEGKRAIHVEAELILSPLTLIVYTKTIEKWFPPYANEYINDEKKSQIINNIKSALKFLEVNYRMI